jgi:hypothetical protein
MRSANKFGFPFHGKLEQWIAMQQAPDKFRIVRLKHIADGIEKEGQRAAEFHGEIVAEERELPLCEPIVLPYRVKAQG